MVSKRKSSSSTLGSLSAEGKQHKKYKGLKGSNQNSDELVVKKSSAESSLVEIESFKDDLEGIEAMTVQELRSKLRSFGVSPKGRKRDLVSALKCFLEKRLNGESSQSVEVKESTICSENVSVDKSSDYCGTDSVKDIDAVVEPVRRQRKRKSKSLAVDVKSVQVSTKVVTKKEANKAAGGKLSVIKKELSSDIVYSTVSNDDGILATQSEPWTVLAHKKPQKHWIPYNPRTMRPPPPVSGGVKVLSWNVNGLRALLKLQGFSALELAERENFDVLCLQETKLQEKDVEDIRQCLIDGYENSFWTCSASKLGYSGTAIISRIKPRSVRYGLGIADHDTEGRLVTAEFDSFYLLSSYVPNSGDGLKRLSYRVTHWDPSLSDYMKELEKTKPVILTGDLNCAHQEIDIYNPAGNRRSAGFTDEERQSFGTNFLSKGFVDTFRRQHPDVVGYTYWGYRHGARKTNKGWRLDYFLVSESIAENVHDSYILPDVLGSDHCPIGLVLKL